MFVNHLSAIKKRFFSLIHVWKFLKTVTTATYRHASENRKDSLEIHSLGIIYNLHVHCRKRAYIVSFSKLKYETYKRKSREINPSHYEYDNATSANRSALFSNMIVSSNLPCRFCANGLIKIHPVFTDEIISSRFVIFQKTVDKLMNSISLTFFRY